MDIPIIARQLKALEEENNRLQLAIDVAESPARLFAALQKAEYGHLKHPSKNEVITLAKGFVAPKKKQVEKEQKFLPLGGGSVVGARR